MKSDRSPLTLALSLWPSPPVGRGLRLVSMCVLIAAILLSLGGCSRSDEDRLEEVRELQAENQMEQSIPILSELIESGNREGEVLYRYGRALSLTGKPERSVWALDAAREDPEWFVRASQQLAIDAHLGENYDFAMEVFERLHAEAPTEMEGDLYALLLEARVLLDSQNHFEEALELIDSILERFPEEDTAIRMKAVALLGLKRPDEAYEILRASNIAPGEDAEAKEKPTEPEGAESDPVADAEDSTEDDGDPGIYLELEEDSRDAYWCAVRTSFKREAGEVEEATKIVDECLAKYPSAAELITEAIKIYTETGRYDRVLETLENAYEASPDDAEIRSALVQYLGRIGRTKDVEKMLRKTVDDDVAQGRGDSVETASHWVDLAGFLLEQDRVGEALIAFDSANKIIGDSASPDLLLREAEALIRAKEYDQALAMAEKTPVEVHGLMLRGRIAFERGEYQKALDELGKAALLWPDNAPIRFYRARAAEGLGEFDLAIEEYRQAVRSESTLSEARERLARLHLAEGNVREAAAILVFQSPRKPSAPSTAMQILMAEVAARRGTEPMLDIPPAPDYPPDRVRAETIRALARGLSLRTNRKVAAGVLSELEKASVAPIRGAFLRERVALLIATGDLDGAVAEARAGLKDRPDDLDSKLALGRALVARGSDLEEATRLLDEVLAKKPDDVEALTSRADLETRSGQLAKADATYDSALKVAPDHWEAFAPRIEHLEKAGKQSEAIQRLELYVGRDAPYDGRGALELARLLSNDEKSRDRRIRLARQAIRFGAGQPAVDLLASLDSEAAAEYLPKRPAATGEPAASADPSATSAPTEEAAEAVPAKAALPEKGSPGAEG